MDISRVIQKKGMVEILAELENGDKTFTQIMNTVRLSMSNIVARLREAEAYRLVSRNAKINEGKVEIKYTLTNKGKEILKRLTQLEAGKILNECKTIKRKANEIEKKLYETLAKTNLKFEGIEE